jgi:hypothetical protein
LRAVFRAFGIARRRIALHHPVFGAVWPLIFLHFGLLLFYFFAFYTSL